MVRPIAGGLFADVMCDAVDEDFNLVGRSVRAATAVGSCSNIIDEVGCASVGKLLQVLYGILRLDYCLVPHVLAQ